MQLPILYEFKMDNMSMGSTETKVATLAAKWKSQEM